MKFIDYPDLLKPLVESYKIHDVYFEELISRIKNMKLVNKLYIECETCKHNNNCKYSVLCLRPASEKVKRKINGKEWVSIMKLKYTLWEPDIKFIIDAVDLLEDDLFEI